MKKLLLSLAVAFGVQLGAQTIDTIVTIDTTTTIDTVTTVDTVMLVNKTDSTLVSIPVSEIDSITFDNDTTTNYNYTYTYDTTVTYDTVWLGACNGLTSLTYNGYVYNLVEIGNQCWFKENLRTVTYRDGTPIGYPGTDNTAWSNDTSGAYAWYNNDSTAHDSLYGKFYNWYAVNKSSGLCPTDWSVPTDSSWTVLESYLEANGYNYDGSTTGNKYAKAMADTITWSSATSTGVPGNTDYPTYRNKSGFSGLAIGYRHYNGNYGNKNWTGYWWSSSSESTHYAWFRRIYRNDVDVFRDKYDKNYGYTVRCIKD